MFKKSLKFSIIIFLLFAFSAGCKKTPDKPAQPITPGEDEIIKIPVVVHVIYAKEEYNISTEKIKSQIAILNQDFRKRNLDFINTPSDYRHLGADIGIEFELATKDPNGNATSGITRTFSTTVDGWNGKPSLINPNEPIENLTLFFTNKGGHDAWPRDKYLNIWVAEMSDHNGRLGLAGYAQFPGGNALSDGVIIDPRCFGTVAPILTEHALGRTTTHEIGHWLNLRHIFEEPTDEVDDTTPDMTANFMNSYVADNVIKMFTEGQKRRMRLVFTPEGERYPLYLNTKNLSR